MLRLRRIGSILTFSCHRNEKRRCSSSIVALFVSIVTFGKRALEMRRVWTQKAAHLANSSLASDVMVGIACRPEPRTYLKLGQTVPRSYGSYRGGCFFIQKFIRISIERCSDAADVVGAIWLLLQPLFLCMDVSIWLMLRSRNCLHWAFLTDSSLPLRWLFRHYSSRLFDPEYLLDILEFYIHI